MISCVSFGAIIPSTVHRHSPHIRRAEEKWSKSGSFLWPTISIEVKRQTIKWNGNEYNDDNKKKEDEKKWTEEEKQEKK